MISIIAAMSQNRVIGKQGSIPWNISEDLARFYKLTIGHVVIMGRKTFESIPSGLPGRKIIVLSRTTKAENKADSVFWTNSLEQAIEKAQSLSNGNEVFIAGGGEIYKQTIGLSQKIYLTVIKADVEGDTFFPEVAVSEWKLKSNKKRVAQVNDQSVTYAFEEWERI